jgi:hypothetical protein
VELCVLAHPELLNRLHLERRDAGAREVHLAERREGQRQDDVVGDHLRCGVADLEGQGVRAGAVLPESNQLVSLLDRAPGKRRDHAGNELVVAADDVVLLVVAGERFE